MEPQRRPWLKPIVDYGPLAAFFIAYWLYDLLAATAALMAVTPVVLLLDYVLERRVAIVPLVTAGIVLVFGGLTLWLHDETFIKMKPTIVELIFAAVLFGGLLFDRPLLKPLFGAAWQLEERGWRILTRRFALFFIAMAGLNELVWRTQSTDVWVNFKVFGLIALTFLFTMAQLPLIKRYQVQEDSANS